MNEPTIRKLGRYEIRAVLGQGGFGTVYRAWDPALEIEVALKVLDPWLAQRDPTLVQGFLREGRISARLHHPGIVRVYDVGEAGGHYYIAMHYLPGGSLGDVIHRKAPLPVTQAVELLRPIAAALDYAHEHGLVHRDVKPGNVIFDEEGRPVLVDFGLVKAAERTTYTNLSGRVPGTVQYAAPEQLSALRAKEVGPATDVYALGIVAYQMLTGQVPFEGETTAVIGSQLNDPPPPPRSLNPDIPAGVEQVLLRALAKKPAERYAGTGLFVAAIQEALEDEVREQRRQAQLAEGKRKLEAGDWAGALAAAEELLAAHPDDAEAAALKQRAEAAQREAEGRARRERERAEQKKRRQAKLAEGEKRLVAKNWAGALAVAEALLAANPDDAEAAALKQRAEAAQREAEELARQERERAEREHRRRKKLGEKRLRAKDWAGALAVAEALLAANPDDAEAAALKQAAEAAQHEVEEQARHERERAEREKRRQAKLAEGVQKLEAGDWAGALAIAEQLRLTDPHDIEAKQLREQAEAARQKAEAKSRRRRQGIPLPWVAAIFLLLIAGAGGIWALGRTEATPTPQVIERVVTATPRPVTATPVHTPAGGTRAETEPTVTRIVSSSKTGVSAATSTVEPTSRPLPTHTRALTHTPEPTRPRVTATPRVATYATPVLVSPEDGASISSPTTFRWAWSGTLGPDEYFDVRVWQEGAPHYGVGWTKETSFRYDPRSKGGGMFYWSVAVIRGRNGQWLADLSAEAPPRHFNSNAGGGGGGGGKPQPTLAPP